MLQDLDAYFASVDLNKFKEFLGEIKREGARLGTEELGGVESAETVKFMVALIENLEEEIQGVSNLETLEFKKKVRVYVMMYFCNQFLGFDGEDDEWGEEDDELDFEEKDEN